MAHIAMPLPAGASTLLLRDDPRNDSYNSVLAAVFLAGSCDKEALLLLDMQQAQFYDRIKSALDNGHLAARRYSDPPKKQSRKPKLERDCLYITPAGLQYLRTQKTFGWLSRVPEGLGRCPPFPNDNHSDAIAFPVRCGNALLMALSMGAHVSDYSFTQPLPQNPPSRMTLPEVRAATFSGLEQSVPAIGNGTAFFFPFRQVREQFIGDDGFRFCHFCGILMSERNTIVLYHAHRNGLEWNKKKDSADRTFAGKFAVWCGMHAAIANGIMAAILIYNAKNFADIVRQNSWQKLRLPSGSSEPNHRRPSGEDDESSCNEDDTQKYRQKKLSRYKHLFLIPVNTNGAMLLRGLVGEGLLAWSRQMILTQCKPTPFNDPNERAFQYLYNNSTYIFNGTSMDLLQILRAIDSLSKQNVTFCVVCFEWQIPFYKAIWPDAFYSTIDLPATSGPSFLKEQLSNLPKSLPSPGRWDTCRETAPK